MESKHSPQSRRTKIHNQNGPNLGIRNPPNHSLFPTKHILPSTSLYHEPSPNQLLPNPRRFHDALHPSHNAHNRRPLRPPLHPHRSSLHRPRPRHHLPPTHGHWPPHLHPCHLNCRLPRAKAQTRSFRSRSTRTPYHHHPHLRLLARTAVQPPRHGGGLHVHWPS